MPDLAFWFFWGFAWCFLVALLLRWTWEADLAIAGLEISSMAWEVRCSQLLQLDPLPTWRWRSAPNENMEKNMEDVQHCNLDFQHNFLEIRLFEQINGWFAVFKWTKTTFRQRFLKRLSNRLECWPRWRNMQHCKQMEWWHRCHRCDAGPRILRVKSCQQQ